MSNYDLSPDARDDLGEIFEYIARDSQVAADRTVRKIAKACRLLADFPGAGPERPDFGRDVRSFPVAPYVIFYRKAEVGVRIIRVVHGARNLKGPL